MFTFAIVAAVVILTLAALICGWAKLAGDALTQIDRANRPFRR